MKEIEVLIATALDPQAGTAIRHKAFGEIVARFQDMAFACAYAVLKDHYLAEDVAQDAFLVAWQRLGQLKEPKAFPGWFKKIVFSECRRLTRGKRLVVMPLESGFGVASSRPDPQTVAENEELSELVLTAMRALPDGERLVASLFYIGGYSQKDIGDFLELRVSAVAKRLFSARRRLEQGLLGMLKENLQQHRPSRHGAFADQVRARLRPAAEPDWEPAYALDFAMETACREGREGWLRDRKQFDESRYNRRQYVAEHVETGQLLGYGAIEQTIFLPKYRLFFSLAPENIRSGVGDLLLERLTSDLHELNAIAIWYRNHSGFQGTVNFLTDRGFVETKVAWDLALNVAAFDPAPFATAAGRVAQPFLITTLAEERQRDQDCLHKLHELLNPVMADEPGCQPFAPVPLDTVARWFSRPGLITEACFIVKDGGRYIGMTALSLTDEEDGGIYQGYTGVLREFRRQGVAISLKLRAIDYARRKGYQFIRAVNQHLNLPMLTLNEKLGFCRRGNYTTLEKCLRTVKPVDTEVYDTYVGRYAFDPKHLGEHKLPGGLTVAIKKVGARLISEIRDMQDELFAESEFRFFIKMHYGEFEFIRGERGQVSGLIYRESGKEMRAAKVE